ncbi:TOMM system kinase/cyclase fusion protein [Polyangium mundeleinium]|uniref:TOMM system kinase/cyclase fusion protein n=1 Tax=Polyangium mundeleinium TaxID=2995306 RepID=A0ABT5ESJ5_9BACT|nr:TOMM system kinase/cyclase fusion protein [Polyangium mundeleinium]MDC0744797.1 TOMM system kinase/cyclase fusion protein [Polyangium mundeleinium]
MGGRTTAVSAALAGRYELLETLKEGAFATVYKARQRTTLQAVAVKVLRIPEDLRGPLHDKRIARFLREVHICAQMHHPNIVHLLDSGRADGGLVYSVFEFVPGKVLAKVLAEEGSLNPIEAQHFMLQVLDALACAHASGVVHRDLKPENLLVTTTGARRNVLVLDFGVGALLEEARGDGSRIPMSLESLGTPAYAAPEQLRGLPLTRRSDLYAWGLVFLECLTGRRAVEGATVAEVMAAQLAPEPIRIPAGIADHPLGRLLRRVTQKDPAARDVTAEKLLRELEGLDLSDLAPSVWTAGPATPVRGPPLDSDSPEGSVEGRARLIEGERRQITAVCLTLTVVSVKPGAVELEELDQILGAQQEACVRIARARGGHVAGALGGAVLFYFGYPTARDDDARRAAQAAFDAMEEIRRQSVALEAGRGVRAELRVGMHTGMVVARELREPASTGPGRIIGATPKLAYRLSLLAQSGAIVVSGETYRLLRGHFAFDEGGEQRLDNATAPVELYLLQQGPPEGERAAPLVGRTREIETLLERFRRVLDGAGQAVVLSGEAGIGKSRLVRELRECIRGETHTWIECRCTPHTMNSPFYPIIDTLMRLLSSGREAAAEDRAEGLEALLTKYGFDLVEAMPVFASLLSIPLPDRWPPLHVSPRWLRELTRNAVLLLLFEMAEREPLVFVVEDVHWADPSTLELLTQLTGELASARVFALFCARPELMARWSPAAVHHVKLERLDRSEVEQLAATVTAGRSLPPEVLDCIADRTDGVPLFVEELVRMMIESGALVEQAGCYHLAGRLSDLSIPSTLRDLLMARLDRLGKAKETAQVAAAIGREFSLDLLSAVDPIEPDELREHLDQLVASDLVHCKRRLKNPVYLFKHVLVRDAAYESMLKRSRREVHARIAAALEEKFPDVPEVQPELFAYHLAASDQKRRALGYAQKAVMGAMQRSANREAIELATEAIDWLPAIEDARERSTVELELNGLLMPALMATRGNAAPEPASVARRSQEILDLMGDHPLAFITSWAQFLYHHNLGNDNQPMPMAQQLLVAAERNQEPAQQAAAWIALGKCLFFAGRLEEARVSLERALMLYDPAEHHQYAVTLGTDPKVHAQSVLSLLFWLLGYPERALAQGMAALARAREIEHANSLGLALVYLAGLRQYRREPEHVRELATEIIEVGERMGLAPWRILGTALVAWVEHDVEAGSRCLSMLQASSGQTAMPYWSSLVAESEAAVGRFGDALARLRQGLALAAELREFYYVAELHRLSGTYLLAQGTGAMGEAEHHFRKAMDVACGQSARMPALRATMALSRILRTQGQIDEARRMLEGVYGWFTEGFETADLKAARVLLAELRRLSQSR